MPRRTSSARNENFLIEELSDTQSKSSPRMNKSDVAGNSTPSASSQPLSKTDEIWWLLARLKLTLTRLQDRLISRNVIANSNTAMKVVREKLEKKPTKKLTQKRTPMQLFSTAAPPNSPGLSATSSLETVDNFDEENTKDWNQVSEFCKKLEEVVCQGREMLENSTTGSSRDRLTEYSFRAGSFIAQMILSEVRSIGNVIKSIDELLVQFRAEISRDSPQKSSDTSNASAEAFRGLPQTFKDLILQETEVLSALTGLTSNRVSSSTKVYI